MIRSAAEASILGRAIKNGHIKLDIVNIRDFSANKHNRVDDYPYGGGAGMVIEAEPVFRAVRAAKEKCGSTAPKVVYLTPQAPVLTQSRAEALAREESLILLCGHYEGIDERVLEEVVTDYISIGDYVLTGGELAALVLMDAVSRFVAGVLSNEESSQFESLQDNLLEYPHYTRPEVWHKKSVPEVLLSGDHKKVNEWRHEMSLKRTKERRPDLLGKSREMYFMYVGADKAEALAEKLCSAASRYGILLNYNRAKLQKQKRCFGEKDLLIFILDETAGDIQNILRNVSVRNSQVFVVSAGGDTAGMAAQALTNMGFTVAGMYEADGEASDEFISETALDIRLKLEQPCALV